MRWLYRNVSPQVALWHIVLQFLSDLQSDLVPCIAVRETIGWGYASVVPYMRDVMGNCASRKSVCRSTSYLLLMSQLTALKAARSLHDVAALLGYKASALAYILFKLGGTAKYKEFDIPKRSGGVRRIKAPMPELKRLQGNLAHLIEHCVHEINEENGVEDRIAHGFKRGRSIFSNAKQHRNRRWVFNLDLEDFFGTINFGRVRGFFIKDRGFALNPDVATILAQIACSDNSLPQGSPSSPIISNLIGHVLDIHLSKLAAKAGCRYTRYADDLSFSTSKPDFPTTVAEYAAVNPHQWLPGKELTRLIRHAGFSVNAKKTRMQYRDSRQEVTGLVINKKVNVRCEYRRSVRAMVHRLFTKGQFDHVRHVSDGKGGLTKTAVAGTIKELHGMLGFIDQVDRYNKEIARDVSVAKGKAALTSKEQVYRRFLLYKEFYAVAKPVIICEGETDNVYVLHAIRALATTFPQLASKDASGKIELLARLFKYANTRTGRILELGGGSSDIARFMHTYDNEIKRFGPAAVHHPVILLVDNDDGALGVGKPFQAAKKITKMDVIRTAPFTHIVGNLYLVLTPLKAGAPQSMIEDFFDAATWSETVSGKSFNPKKDADPTKHYGKKIFAHKVVRPNADKIDFSGFSDLLTNIALALGDYYSKHPAVPTARP
jgi:RNA-directed DNA polymerase